jgi:A/G-specific adenine glycosylase
MARGRRSEAIVRLSVRQKSRAFRKFLLSWWNQHKITYPWRSYTDPWQVLLAETLLRKTNAEKVERFIPEVTAAFPSPQALLSISRQDLEGLLVPFGMQKRKTQELRHLAARVIETHGGRVPANAQDLKALPGVGDYIANAVLCFSFGQRRAVVDTNVIRVLLRVFGLSSVRSRPRTDPEIWQFAERLLPRRRYKDYNWALLDLAKKVCRARRPLHEECPLASICSYYLAEAERRT